MLKWELGRQGTGYYKFKIFMSKILMADCYILKYPKGSEIPTHTDPSLAGHTHHRINLVLRKAQGGEFYTEINGTQFQPQKRIVKFRPDIIPHGVTKITDGTRYVLSLGWLSKIK